MIKLGVSVYPEQEKLSDIEEYLRIASHYGFEKVFTSLFSVDGSKDEIIKYFKSFTAIAHKYGMVVSGDCNSLFFASMGATESDLSVFKEMGIDIIRMDFSYNDERDAVLVNNPYSIGIEMSTSFVNTIENALKHGANPHNLTTCHNFYPQRYTAPSVEKVDTLNKYWKAKGLRTALFITSQQEGTHGPWPVSDGLPTIEDHRDLPIEIQMKHCLAMGSIDEIIVGNAYASEEEFSKIAQVLEKVKFYQPLDPRYKDFANVIPHGDIERIPLSVVVDEEASPLEKKLLLDFNTHSDIGDSLYYLIRSRATRTSQSIPFRHSGKEYYQRGDILIVNDNLAHYRGEIQIVLKPMKVDQQRNLVGHLRDEELFLLDYISANDVFVFVKE